MKKTVYVAPAIALVKIQSQSLMDIIGASGDAKLTVGGQDSSSEGTGGDSRRRSLWDDDEW